MKIRNVSVLVFYTSDKKILLQDRRSISKWGEEWGLFGGRIEKEESAEEALVREIQEELTYTLSTYEKVIEFKAGIKKYNIGGALHLFVAPMPEDSAFDQKEGDGRKLFSIEEAKTLKLNPVDHQTIEHLEKFLENKK